MTKEGNEPPQEVIATLLETIGDEKYPYPHGMSEQNYYMAGRLMEELKKFGWVPPTPPTPAGAGTETPSGDVLLSRVRAEALDAELTALRLQSHRDKATIRELESAHNIRSDECEGLAGQLSEARRQAEADRATLTRLEEELKGERNMHGQTRVVVEELNTICNDLRNAGQPQFIRSEAIRLLREEVASLRGLLASADKDRERMRTELLTGLRDLMATQQGMREHCTWDEQTKYEGFLEAERKHDIACINSVVLLNRYAALQPSPSLDHGATDTKTP